jgi:hypothetical protein
MFTFLGWSMVFAWSRSAGTVASGLLDAQCAAFKVGSMQAFNGGLSLLRASEFDEAKTARVIRMRITHDVSVRNLTILLECAHKLVVSDARGDTSDEEVRAWVFGASVRHITAVVSRRSA